jgi:hypothetical protein
MEVGFEARGKASLFRQRSCSKEINNVMNKKDLPVIPSDRSDDLHNLEIADSSKDLQEIRLLAAFCLAV